MLVFTNNLSKTFYLSLYLPFLFASLLYWYLSY